MTQATTCPSCGHPLPALAGILIDKASCQVEYATRQVCLTRNLFEIFEFLLARPTRPASLESIYAHLYQLRQNPPESKTVVVQISKLRAKIRTVGLEIGTVHGVGYWLIDPSGQIKQAFADMYPKHSLAMRNSSRWKAPHWGRAKP